MRIISKENPEAVSWAVKVILDLGIAVLPCDTIYGIVGSAPETERLIRAAKGRGEHAPFLMLIGEEAWIRPFTDAALPASLRPYWPGPLTVLFPGKPHGKVGFRVPEDPLLTRILLQVKRPLYSTSVNLSGAPPFWKIGEIIKDFGDKVDLIVDAGDLPDAVPSTVVDITTKPYTVLRQGKMSLPDSVLR